MEKQPQESVMYMNRDLGNINPPKPSSSYNIPLIIIITIALLATALALILALTLKKKKRSNVVKIRPDETVKNQTDIETDIEIEDSWKEPYNKAENLVSKLSLTERVNLLFGTQNMKMETLLIEDESELQYLCVGQIDPFKNKDIDFKGMCLQDGPAGVRFAKGTGISWQGSMNNAMTFDKQLMYEVGKAQGEENRAKGINVALTPCANMMRNPKGGRSWEAYGDDPYYVGVCAYQVTKGLQDAGVIAGLKEILN